MTTAREEENLRPSMVRYSLETTSVGRFSGPSGPGWPPRAPGPLDGRGQVPDHRVEPDVDPLVRPVPPAVERNGHAPVQVARYRPRLQVVEEVEGELEHVRPPVARLGLQPGAQHLGERRQVQEIV